MTFTDPKVEGQTTEGLNLTLTFRAFLYDSSLVENDWPKAATQEGKLIHTYWNHNTTQDEESPFKNIVRVFQIGSENVVGTNLADTLLKYKATKEEVMTTARTWTITTTEDGCEQLIINFGTPGSTGLTYADIFDDATIAALQESFDAEIAYIEEILGENTKNGDEGSGNDTIADPLTGQVMPRWQWEEFKTIFQESKEYWAKDSLEHKYVYSFDAHVVTAVKYDSDTHKYDEGAFNTEKVTNGFNVSHTKGEESISKDYSATYNNFWRNGLAANAKAGDVVIFKADAAAENGTPKPWNPNAASPNIPTIESPIQGVKFRVYADETDETLKFTQDNLGRYRLSDSGDTTELTTDQAGAIVITGLDKDTTYYIEEVEAAEDYKPVTGRTPIKAAANVVTPYLIENTKLPSNVTVTFDKNNTDEGSTEANPNTKTVEKGGKVDALPTPPTRPGYTFTGWNTEKDGSGSEFTAETVVNENITVYAQWEKSQYTIKYEYTGTVPEGAPQLPADKKVDFGSEQTVAAAPTLDGWTFTGWTTDDANVSNGSFTMPANDVTFTGSWTKNQTYTVTYEFDGDAPENVTAPVDGNNYEAGKTVTVLTPGSVPPGYRFEGWTLGEETYEPEDTFEMPAFNVTLTGTWAKLGEVVVKPAPVTIYMGGEDGHDGVVNDAGAIQANNSLPVPGFTVEWPVADVNISELVFNAGEKSWKLESYDGVSTTIYKLVPSGTQDPIRMQFTNADNVTVTSDDFEVGANVNQTLTMQLYKDSVGQVTVKIGDDTYIVDSDYTADLTVRGTTAAPEYAGVNDDITADKPGLTAPEGTEYTINEGQIKVTDTTGVALLFDDIIDTADENRTDMLLAEAETQDVLPELETGNRYGYEFKYLDLVDTHNGNVWVQASNTVTVYWPLPAGTDAETEFTLLHFTGLHREMASGEIADEIQDCKIENVKVENTGTHVKFTIGTGGFSPFALVWQEPSPSSDMSVTKTADKDRIEVGETVTYTITVTNTGNQRLENISVTGVFSGRGELELSGDTTFSLDPGESRTLTAAYKALRSDAGAILTNTVTAVCGELNVSATEKVKVERPWIPTPPPGGDDDDEPEKPDDVVPPMLNGDDHYAYIIGYEDGTVRPNGQITRAEVATIIFRLLKPEVRDGNLTDVNSFTDVNEGDWYNIAISTLVKLGIIEGRSDTIYDPNAAITRAKFATLFTRFDESGAAAEGGFSDIANHWARESIECAAALGWINGYEDGTFRPDNAITRAEAMTMINRVLNRDPVENDDLLPDMRVWSDNRPGAWYYFAVQEATNSHEYIRPDSHEDWTEMTPDPD